MAINQSHGRYGIFYITCLAWRRASSKVAILMCSHSNGRKMNGGVGPEARKYFDLNFGPWMIIYFVLQPVPILCTPHACTFDQLTISLYAIQFNCVSSIIFPLFCTSVFILWCFKLNRPNNLSRPKALKIQMNGTHKGGNGGAEWCGWEFLMLCLSFRKLLYTFPSLSELTFLRCHILV